MAKRMPDNMGEVNVRGVATRASASDVSAIEKSARAEAKLRTVSAFKLMAHDLQPLERHSDENVRDLAQSILSIGLQQPPLVRRLTSGEYVILAGHRRARAWQLLASQGAVDEKLRVFVLDRLADGEDVAIIAAEYAHRRENSPLHTARLVGAAWRFRRTQLGHEPTVRELADLLPWQKSQVDKYLKVSEALENPRLAALVHRVDKPRIALLYQILTTKESQVETALEAYGTEGPAAAREIISPAKDPRVEAATTWTESTDGGFRLEMRIGASPPKAEAEVALARIRLAEQRLLEMVGQLGAENDVAA